MRIAIYRALRRFAFIGCCLVLALTTMAQDFPDELQLVNGRTLQGKFITGDMKTIVFNTNDGVKTFAKSEVRALYLDKAATPSSGGANTNTNTNTTTTTTNNQTNPPSPDATDPPTERAIPTDDPAVVDAGVEAIEQAFRDRDIEKVVSLCFPTQRDRFRAIFTKHREELTDVADLLATRKLVETYGSYAEYQVTSQGNNFPVVFTRYGNVWCLSQL